MSIEVMKLALAALENHSGNYKLSKTEGIRHNAAVKALHQAIEDTEKQEPVACVCGEPTNLGIVHRTDGPCFHYTEPPKQEPVGEVLNIQWMSNTGGWLIGFHSKRRLYKGDKLYVKPMSIKPENIDTKTAHVDGVDIKPVAWLESSDWGELFVSKERNGSFPVYTAPPKREWQSLTNDEINGLDYSGTRINFVRAIEAKLKEKNT